MLPWYPSDQGGAGQGSTLFFHLGDATGVLNITLKAEESGYKLRAFGASGMITVAARGGRGTEQLTLRHVGTMEPQVLLSNRRGAAAYDVQIANIVQPRERVHVLRARNLRVPEGATVELAALDRARTLSLASPTARIDYDLELRALTRAGEDVLSRPDSGQNAEETRIVRPRNWNELKSMDVLYQRSPDRLSNPGRRSATAR
jgi:hypothetical protein